MAPITSDAVCLKSIARPNFDLPHDLPVLPDILFQNRLSAIRVIMEKSGLDMLAIYADREHYANFRYFVGFEPRFEEGLLVIGKNDPSYVLLGNECHPMHPTAKIAVEGILCQAMSLPNQPMDAFTSMAKLLAATGMKTGVKVGLAGWKLFGPAHGSDFQQIFCAPSFIVDAIKKAAGEGNVTNATGLLVNPDTGLRITNEADQIAVFEYGAALASQGLMNMWDNLEVGKSEFEMADYLVSHGLQQTCHIIVSAGPNCKRGLVSPTSYRLKAGDAITGSLGLEGGLSCRGGYLCVDESGLPKGQGDYISGIVKPYFAAAATWYEKIGIDVQGGEIFDSVQSVLPKEKFGWTLNPGHLIANEEWLSSPIRPGSKDRIKSGMVMQMDIIPAGNFHSPNVEDGVVIADRALQDEIKAKHPEVWSRLNRRREFMRESLGITLRDEVFPMSNLAGLYRPLALNRELALVVRR